MSDRKIRAVLLLDFGKINTTRFFRQGARLSYDFLKSAGQPVGKFNYYCWRNLISLRIRGWISNITKNDFNSLVLLRGIGTKKGIKLDRQQWRHFAWLWYEPLSKISRVERFIPTNLIFASRTLESLRLPPRELARRWKT
jgi:hypothetical protein